MFCPLVDGVRFRFQNVSKLFSKRCKLLNVYKISCSFGFRLRLLQPSGSPKGRDPGIPR
jgi:hypothetical protein